MTKFPHQAKKNQVLDALANMNVGYLDEHTFFLGDILLENAHNLESVCDNLLSSDAVDIGLDVPL